MLQKKVIWSKVTYEPINNDRIFIYRILFLIIGTNNANNAKMTNI